MLFRSAALAEHCFGALQGARTGAYITVGTGIGAGLIAHGAVVHGMLHPEVGHIRVLRTPADGAAFIGCCPYHGDCLEGLAAGPAIERRWGASLSKLPADHEAHALIADYLGQLCATLALTLSTHRIVIGGGVSHTPDFHAAIAVQMLHWLGGYLPDMAGLADTLVVAPVLGDQAGLMGAILMAERACR